MSALPQACLRGNIATGIRLRVFVLRCTVAGGAVRVRSMRLGEIAKTLGCRLDGDPELEIFRLWPIESAAVGDLCFVANPAYAKYLAETKATAVIVANDTKDVAVATLRTENPYLAFSRALELFGEVISPSAGIHPSANIDATAVIGEGASVGPNAYVEAKAVIGRDACLGANVCIGYGSEIGDGFRAHANVVVRERIRIGDNVTLHAGVIVGADGFGYVPSPEGGLVKLPQIGSVRIGNDVEVGANATIDRATIGETRIGNGVKIDNLVQIGHGCSVGDNTVIAAQAGLAGSTRVGAWVQLGGQSGTAGHLSIGDASRVAGKAGITADVEGGSVVAGFPAQPIARWRRTVAVMARLGDLMRRVRRLERAAGERGERSDA